MTAVSGQYGMAGRIRCGSRLESSIWVLTDKFINVCDQIVRKVCDHTRRSPRALFFLDQYGYSKIPMPVIAGIFQRIGHAEVILNLHISALMTYINDEILERACQGLGIADVRSALGGHSVADLKRTEAGARKLIQCALFRSVVDGCQAKHYTNFFSFGDVLVTASIGFCTSVKSIVRET